MDDVEAVKIAGLIFFSGNESILLSQGALRTNLLGSRFAESIAASARLQYCPAFFQPVGGVQAP